MFQGSPDAPIHGTPERATNLGTPGTRTPGRLGSDYVRFALFASTTSLTRSVLAIHRGHLDIY